MRKTSHYHSPKQAHTSNNKCKRLPNNPGTRKPVKRTLTIIPRKRHFAHNFTDTPDQKDIIPLNLLQHFTPHYTEHLYSHLVKNLYAHKTDIRHNSSQTKCGRPPKPKSQIQSSNPRTPTAAKNMTIRPQQHPRSLNNEIVTRQMINEIHAE